MCAFHTFSEENTRRCNIANLSIPSGYKRQIFNLSEDLTLDCYLDADFAGLYGVEDDQDPVCVKSRTGYCVTLDGCPLILGVQVTIGDCPVNNRDRIYCFITIMIPMRRLLQARFKFSREANSEIVFEDNNGALSIAHVTKNKEHRNKASSLSQ